MSFRSTEFIDDAVRDNQETNTMDVKEFGWAFGQISDMEKFWSGLGEDVRSKGVTVTGYSLGGHLATAFTLMHSDKVNAAYTFNGAGVGTVSGGYGQLGAVIQDFNTWRKEGSADWFTDPVARREYQRPAAKYVKGASWDLAELEADIKAEDMPGQMMLPAERKQRVGGYAH